MIIHALLSFFFLSLQPPSSLLVSGLNLSHIIHSSPSPSDEESSDGPASGLSFPDHIYSPRPSEFTEDVLRTIAAKQKWDLDEIRVSKLKKARFARFQNYEFQVRIGKTDLAVKSSEELDSWIILGEYGDFKNLINHVRTEAELTPFEVEGPVELIAGEGDRLSLRLPKNATFSSLKRILVGNGIKLQISQAQEISLFHGSCGGSANASSKEKRAAINFWPVRHPYCTWFLPVHISGPASVIAYEIAEVSNPPIEANFLSKDTIELKPAKCYNNHVGKKFSCPINSLSSRISTMENLLKRLLSSNVVSQSSNYNSSTSLKAKVKASTMVQFRLELRREVRNGGYVSDKKFEEWRTRPRVEHAWFDVTARVYGEGERWQPILVKSVKPFVAVDSASWSNVLNVSFTKFPTRLVPSRPLTLGVKW